jgi:AcrR family transcriptional regulator
MSRVSSPRRAATRLRLYEAAVALVAEQGYAATTVEEIAVRAGVAKGTVYYHFEGRTEFFEALLKHCGERFAEALREAADRSRARDGDPSAVLDAVVRAGLAFVRRHPALDGEPAQRLAHGHLRVVAGPAAELGHPPGGGHRFDPALIGWRFLARRPGQSLASARAIRTASSFKGAGAKLPRSCRTVSCRSVNPTSWGMYRTDPVTAAFPSSGVSSPARMRRSCSRSSGPWRAWRPIGPGGSLQRSAHAPWS